LIEERIRKVGHDLKDEEINIIAEKLEKYATFI